MASQMLIIGYGNALRRDDGLGPAVATMIQARGYPDVSVVTRHQLTPELADQVRRAHAVLFIDASLELGQPVRLRRVRHAGPLAGAHVSDPGALLALAAALYGAAPPAWILTVPAFDLGFGEGLSAQAQSAATLALEAFEGLFRGWHDAEAAAGYVDVEAVPVSEATRARIGAAAARSPGSSK